MSHFTVGVVIDDLSKLDECMAPYDEHLKVKKYISRTRSQLIEEAKEIKERIMSPDYRSSASQEWRDKYLNASTDEEFYNAIIDDDTEYDDNGNELSTYNPNSKYDYYSEYERYLVRHYDRTLDPKAYNDALKEWDSIIDGTSIYNPEYYINRFKDRETYATICATPHTYALLVDGEWYEKGKCGWFGSTDATYESEMAYLNKFNEVMSDPKYSNYFFVLVDCHI